MTVIPTYINLLEGYLWYRNIAMRMPCQEHVSISDSSRPSIWYREVSGHIVIGSLQPVSTVNYKRHLGFLSLPPTLQPDPVFEVAMNAIN